MARQRREGPTIENIMGQLHKDKVRFIHLQFTDVLGVVKSVTIPVEQFGDCMERGKWFDGSSVDGLARILESDMYLKPDLSTLAVLPWERNADESSARVICWVLTPQGETFTGDPRTALMRVMEEAAEMGYQFRTAPELEFFLFSPGEGGCMTPLRQDRGGYFDLGTGPTAVVRKEMVKALQDIGIQVETSHHEIAVGQHEIDLTPQPAITSSDNLITCRYTLRAIAQRHGLDVTFMPKPLLEMEGSGLHIHQSLFFIDNNHNAFADPQDEYGLSTIARHFIAGLLHHAPGMSALLCPLVNSYKRLVPGFEAPVHITWARVNRSALIRVPLVNPQKRETTRVELRNPDPSCNPYLAFAAMLKAGLHGIRDEMPLPPPVEESLFAMDAGELQRRHISAVPGTLGEALDALRRDQVVQEALAEPLYTKFLEAKAREWEDYRRYVTPWEIDHYLGVW
ncbi:MAG: type I glutamate--ammonia ligase [Dehalococcoidia bacterium]|jgi:glutamine synthetase|nr:type I glutamate--ammonia ligase [Dehalococcoidia bacterium]MDP7240170.1 type I glutamate--ammonia ligase [Dehalococcoidia bacterium]MDP7469983.1 type I glutamate--ammonia ligase [Dehalococcoidia bacterium]